MSSAALEGWSEQCSARGLPVPTEPMAAGLGSDG